MTRDGSDATLFVVDTPIGNLQDLSRRAERVLREVSLVVAEDTRRTNQLLLHLDTEASLLSFHEHSGPEKRNTVVSRIREKGRAALVSDAGSPVVSDPGGRIVRALRETDVAVVPVPGPSAVTAALAVSGFPANRFRFAGYPPGDGTERETWFRSIRVSDESVVIFVPPHDLVEFVSALSDRMPDRQAVAAKELTKQHETVYRGSCSELPNELAGANIKGEWTIVIEPGGEETADEEPVQIPGEELDTVLDTGVKLSSGARILAELRDVSRGKAYDLLQRRKEERGS